MNHLHPTELPFLIRDIQTQMPRHTPKTAQIPHSYVRGLPKNLMEYSALVNKKFLDNKLSVIEDIHAKDPKHPIPRWFRDYQIGHYASHGILTDSFFTSRMRDGYRRHLAPNLTETREIGIFGNLGQYIMFGRVNGAELTGGGTGFASTSLVGLLNAIQLSIGVAGQYYDQIAFDWNAAAGNERLGVYDDSSNPNNLLAESSSAAVATGFGYKSVTEFALTTNQAWAAMCADNAGASAKYTTAGGNLRITRVFVYGALPNPFGGTPSADNANLHCKVGHS